MDRALTLSAVLRREGSPRGSAVRWERWLKYVYRNVEFAGRRVLDIGAGAGLHSLHAALAGATVVALEPSGPGGSEASLRQLRARAAVAPEGSLQIQLQPIEALSGDGDFDVVLCINTINHIDERLVTRLPDDTEAIDRYRGFLDEVHRRLRPGGILVLSDASPENRLKWMADSRWLRHPFAPTINWSLHQPPEVWTALAAQARFGVTDVTWDPPRQLITLGDWLARRGIASWLTSHFVLTMRRMD